MPKFKDPSPYIDEIETFQGNTVFEDVYITGDLYYDGNIIDDDVVLNTVEIKGTLKDGDGEVGTAGQVLSFDGNDLKWINDSSDKLHTNSVQNITGPGAISLTETVTFITTTGANAYTLADGIEGQLKIIIMKVDGGNGTITPDNLVGWTSIRFDSVNDNVQLLYGSTGWNIIALQQATRIS